VVATIPRAFVMKNLLSAVEVDHRVWGASDAQRSIMRSII
jgi:hypothetical protein